MVSTSGRSGGWLAGLLALWLACACGSADAQQRQDWMLDIQPKGSFAIVVFSEADRTRLLTAKTATPIRSSA